MDTIKYRALLETIAQGSLTKAAEVLGYSQPGISHMIRALEQEFGFALLRRAKMRFAHRERRKTPALSAANRAR